MPGVNRQSDCAAFAARAARSASSARARGTWSIVSSVAGFSTGKVSPERLSTNSPPMSILYMIVTSLPLQRNPPLCRERLCKSLERHIDQVARDNQRRFDANHLGLIECIGNQH